MQVVTKTVILEDKNKPISLYFLGDFHVGSTNTDYKALEKKIDEIKEIPNAFAVLTGDLAECIEIKDKRFNIASVDKRFYTRLGDLSTAQFEYVKNLLEPISSKILCAVKGNHENKIITEYSHDVHLDLCRNLKIPDIGTTGFLVLKLNREQYHAPNLTVFLTHGWASGRLTGNKVNLTESLANSFSADIYINGHTHSLWVSNKSFISVAGNGIKTKDKWFGNSGSFLKTYDEDGNCYAEKECLPPTKIGCLLFKIFPSSNSLEIKSEL